MQKDSNTSRWSSRNYYRISIVKIILAVQISKILHCVVIPPKVQQLVFVWNGLVFCSAENTTIAIRNDYLCPIIKDRIFKLLSRPHALMVEVGSGGQDFTRAQTPKSSIIALVQCFDEGETVAHAATIEIKHELVFVGTTSLMDVNSGRWAIETGRSSLLRKKNQRV